MRDDVLERKISRIIVELSRQLGVSEDRAIDLFYSTDAYGQLTDPDCDLHLRSDGYILEEVRRQIEGHSVESK